MRPLPLPYARQRDEPPLPPVARLYSLRTPRSVVALRGLRALTWQAARTALLVGEADPGMVLAELRQLLGDLAARWAGLSRDQAVALELRLQAEAAERTL